MVSNMRRATTQPQLGPSRPQRSLMAPLGLPAIVIGAILLAFAAWQAAERLAFDDFPAAEARLNEYGHYVFAIPDGRRIDVPPGVVCVARCAPGSTATMRYDPARPRRAEPEGEPGTWFTTALPGVPGLILVLAGLSWMRRDRREAVEPPPSRASSALVLPIERVVPSVDGDGPFWRIVARGMEMNTGRSIKVESPRLRMDPTPFLAGITTVRIGGAYGMALDFLPPELLDRMRREQAPPASPPMVPVARRQRVPLLMGVAALLVIAALWLCWTGTRAIIDEMEYRDGTELTDARIASLLEVGHGESYDWRTPVLAFRLPDGREVQARSTRTIPFWTYYGEGDLVAVRYDPDDPSVAAVDLGFGAWLDGAPFLLMALILFGTAVFIGSIRFDLTPPPRR